MKTVYELDGNKFDTLDEFYDEVSRVLIPGAQWGRNLDAFNDILRGGFGTPNEGFKLIWKNAARSRKKLGHPETAKFHDEVANTCHPAYRETALANLQRAREECGPTVFDMLVEIIRDHGPDGGQPGDGVELMLL
jgi:RNAse (barnase) inhibitor barstar